ncbi:MAG: aldehyde dehydrogenase family protein [Myxococcota bacterium]
MNDTLKRLGLNANNSGAWAGAALNTADGLAMISSNPADGKPLASFYLSNETHYEQVVLKAEQQFQQWRMLPAPKRGEIVRQMGEKLREHKDDLGRLVSLEVGKVLSEGLGEVQESIDMADFCVGLSRQLYGLTMHSERARHRMYEQWHPLGIVGVITAFNFPNAVWAWNAMVAMVCGNAVIWKPSLKAPLTAIATHRLMNEVLKAHGFEGLLGLIIGSDEDIGERFIADKRIPLMSATGSTRMGRHVNQVVAGRLGRCLLELGGNNAVIVEPSADLDLAVRGVTFAAVGTAGQRCTTTRRLFLHRSIYDSFLQKLKVVFEKITHGNPLQDGVLLGPLIDEQAVQQFEEAIKEAKAQGGTLVTGGGRIAREGYFVQPTIIEAKPDMAICQHETFAPILYVFAYDNLDEAIRYQNDVPQGLSSAIFTDSMKSMEQFLSHEGSDCGIANVNIGTSGAEIGGAFGGEKETGGGREAGSDSWKAYMRRQTCTLNWSPDLPLAQGVSFDV